MSDFDQTLGPRIRRMIDGYQVTAALAVAATLGIADRLADGAQRSDDLARATGAEAKALYRLLRALASIDILAEEDDRRFALTPLGAWLRDGAERSHAIQAGAPEQWAAWGALHHSVMTGAAAFAHVHGTTAWAYREQHADAGRRFVRATMGASPTDAAASILGAYDFAGTRCVVDVGGGNGATLAGILLAHPHLRGILLDQGQIVAGAAALLREAGLLDRCAVVAGDFLQSVPAGGDIYLLKGVLHNWPDDAARRILANCRQAMEEDGTLLVVGPMLPMGSTPSPSQCFMDLHMLVMHGGAERTDADLAALLAATGFQLSRVSRATSMPLFEARQVTHHGATG